jgi:hypothetical protein
MAWQMNFKSYQDASTTARQMLFIIKTIVNHIVGNGLVDKTEL